MVLDLVRTVVRCCESRAVRQQRLIHPGGDCLEASGIEKALPDCGLIGNDNHWQPERRQLLQRLTDTRHKNELRPVKNVVSGASAIDHAIAINKDGRTSYCPIWV